MNAEQLSFPSEPIAGETRSTVELVGGDWRADEDWRRFRRAVDAAAYAMFQADGSVQSTKYPAYFVVDPNDVRKRLTKDGKLTIEPRRYSAFWARAAGKNGFLDADGWVINTDAHGRNQGKPLRRYRLRAP